MSTNRIRSYDRHRAKGPHQSGDELPRDLVVAVHEHAAKESHDPGVLDKCRGVLEQGFRKAPAICLLAAAGLGITLGWLLKRR